LIIDLAILVGIVALFAGFVDLARHWTAPFHEIVEIDLSPLALPRYVFYSLCRGLIAFGFSLLFTLIVGFWAAKDLWAGRIIPPILDILQSIPVLGFMPGLVIGLVAAFPNSNIGLELACILMIFTAQVWNMTFSLYHSLRAVPQDLREAARTFGFSPFQTAVKVELPFAATGLVWNGMMSMAGGWFFLMVNEAFTLGDTDYRLPGIGSYMSAAVQQNRTDSMLLAVVAMMAMIILLDQLFWKPITVWVQRFRIEESSDAVAPTSWFLNLLGRSSWWRWIMSRHIRLPVRSPRRRSVYVPNFFSLIPVVLLGVLVVDGVVVLWDFLIPVTLEQWFELGSAAGITLGRVMLTVLLGTLWAVPVGLWIGLSPKWSQRLQPVVQVLASFPAPMIFPIVIGIMTIAGISLGWGSIVLMMLGTQWYILFNVIAGASTIPGDLKEMTRSFRISRYQRFRVLYLPCVFPYLVTGWVTAAGGAWNASIIAEYVAFRGDILQTQGLGAVISNAAAGRDLPLLAAGVVVMAGVVVVFNRLVWKRLYRLAENRYSLNK